MRLTTVGLSLSVFCRGLLHRLDSEEGYDVVAVSSPDTDLDDVASREGVRTVGVPMSRHIAPIADLRSLLRLIRLMRRERPQILHTMTPKAGLLGMIAGRIAGVPVRIHTFTGLLFPTAKGLKRSILKMTDALTCACATHIIPEGAGVRADLIEARITAKPLRVLANGNVRGIDPDHYSRTPEVMAEAEALRERLGIAPGERVAVFVGRLVGDKGLNELAEAWREVYEPASHPARLVLAGDTEGGADDIDKAAFASIPGVILSDGWVDDVRPWLAMADFLVFPSYREGFPNVVLEAAAMQLPSIVTDINGSREIVANGRTGLIIPPRDAKALARAIAIMLRQPAASLATIGEDARADAIARFNTELVQQALIDYYNKVVR